MRNPDLDLRQTLEAYPGRLSRLSEQTGTSYTTLRRVRDCKLVRVPWDLLREIARAPAWAEVPGCALPYTSLVAHLAALYERARGEVSDRQPARQ